MSKNIVIQEGGQGKQLTADKLKTNLVGGGTCLWVPEDGTRLGTKHISENGTYRASDDGYYGYEQVTVSGIGKATGTDGDGDEAVAYPDPETGRLITDKVPSRIEVVTPPTNPYGIYENGQSISTNGMVVKAYLETGGEYGTVPNGEITIEPTVAAYDESTDQRGRYTGDGITAQKYTSSATPVAPNSDWYAFNDFFTCNTPSLSLLLTRYDGNVYVASADGSSGSTTYAITKDGHVSSGVFVYGPSFTRRSGGSSSFDFTPVSTSDPSGKTVNDLTPVQAGSHQAITVSWPRPHDGKILETTFEILVAPGYGGDEGDNGNGED